MGKLLSSYYKDDIGYDTQLNIFIKSRGKSSVSEADRLEFDKLQKYIRGFDLNLDSYMHFGRTFYATLVSSINSVIERFIYIVPLDLIQYGESIGVDMLGSIVFKVSNYISRICYLDTAKDLYKVTSSLHKYLVENNSSVINDVELSISTWAECLNNDFREFQKEVDKVKYRNKAYKVKN